MRALSLTMATVLALIALLLPFVGVGFSDGPMSSQAKLLGSGVLLIVALLLVLISRKRSP
jgi:uncharacterized membrane protein YqaE (UPF0057 family)